MNFILPNGTRLSTSGSIVSSGSRRRTRDLQEPDNNESELFVDKYKPTTEADLCVMPAKIKALKEAIQQSALYSLAADALRLIVITGPTGSCKSATVHLLAKTMNLDISEWENPMRYEFDPTDRSWRSTMDKFRHFLSSAARYGMLKNPQSDEHGKKKIILLDDIPDLTTTDVLNSFQKTLLRTLSFPHQFLIILILNDHPLESANIPYNSYVLRNMVDVIPKDLYNHPRVVHIKFNEVTVRKMKKALERIISAENLFVPPDRLEDLIVESKGDIRFAINNLQLEPRLDGNNSKRKKAKKSPLSSQSTRSEDNEPSPFYRQKGTLSIFHAIGKVLHAKRLPNGRLDSSPEHILSKLSQNTDQFISHIHQNCPPYFRKVDIDSYARCLNYLSEADTIRSETDWQGSIAANYRAEVSVRGMMTKPPTTSVGAINSFRSIEALDVQRTFEQGRKEIFYKEWMDSVRARNITENEVKELLEEDPIEFFSEDEFDDEFGSGADLVALLEQ